MHVFLPYEALVNLYVVASKLIVENDDTMMLQQTNFVNTFTKGKNRSHFAASLVEKLIDEETRVKSNIRGRGKEKLDPTITAYVRVSLITLLILHFT